MQKYEIHVFETQDGRSPFQDWLDGLKDDVARTKIYARITRMGYGAFGDWKSIQGVSGLFELRENRGPGYRVYYTIRDEKIVLLLAGSTKRDQKRVIEKAKAYLADYEGK